MRKVILSVLLLVVLLGFIGATFTSHKDIPQHPVSISGGLRFEIPYKQSARFYLTGLIPQTKYELKHFLANQVIHPLIDSTQVLYDDELITDSGINYVTSEIDMIRPKIVTIYLGGDLDPKKIRGFITRKRK